MVAKTTDQVPAFALCPRCCFPLNPFQWYNVDFCAPARVPPPAPTTPANHEAIQHRSSEGAPAPPPPAVESTNARPSPSFDPPSGDPPPSPEQPHDVASLSPSSPTRVASPTPDVHKKERRSSAASTEYSFSDRLSYDAEYEAVLRQTEALYFSQKETQTPTSPPTSSPSTESSLVPSISGELPTGRRWVVFRGRVPGVYSSSYVFQTFLLTPSNTDDPPQR